MSPLERHLEAARGWMLLGNAQEAGRELEGIDDEHWLDPRVLVVRAGVFHALKVWAQLQIVARLRCDARPLDSQWPISLALATRYIEGPERNVGILMDAIQAFPDVPGAYYGLACCEAAGQRGPGARMARGCDPTGCWLSGEGVGGSGFGSVAG